MGGTRSTRNLRAREGSGAGRGDETPGIGPGGGVLPGSAFPRARRGRRSGHRGRRAPGPFPATGPPVPPHSTPSNMPGGDTGGVVTIDPAPRVPRPARRSDRVCYALFRLLRSAGSGGGCTIPWEGCSAASSSQCTYRCVVLPDPARRTATRKEKRSLNAPTGAWCSLTSPRWRS